MGLSAEQGGDPNEAIRTQPMSLAQMKAVAVGMVINAVDGYDILSISLAAPGISSAWGIDRGMLGLILAMEVIGGAAGAILLGRFADIFGRRTALLGGLTMMTIGMCLSAFAPSILALACCRILTGLGIGGMLPALTSMVAETASERRRDLCVTFLGFGFLMGGILGGTIAASLLSFLPWPWVFALGGVLTAGAFMLTLLWVPETIAYLLNKQPRGALVRINAVRSRFGHPPVAALPIHRQEAKGSRVRDLFGPSQLNNTLLITAAYFFHMSAFYFILKWLPKILSDMGHSAATAASMMVVVNLGGIVGTLAVGPLAQRFGIGRVTIFAMCLSAVSIALLGRFLGDYILLVVASAVTGLITAAAVTGLYAVMVRGYPSPLRGTGIGFSLGLGRGGAAVGPITAGFLFTSGMSVSAVALIMGLGAIIAALAISRTQTIY